MWGSGPEQPGSGCEGCQVIGLPGGLSRQQTPSRTASYRFLSCLLPIMPGAPHLAPTPVTGEIVAYTNLPKAPTRPRTSAGVSDPKCCALSTISVLSPVKMDPEGQTLLSWRAGGRVGDRESQH